MGDADFYPNGGMEQPGCAGTVDAHLVSLFQAGFIGNIYVCTVLEILHDVLPGTL